MRARRTLAWILGLLLISIGGAVGGFWIAGHTSIAIPFLESSTAPTLTPSQTPSPTPTYPQSKVWTSLVNRDCLANLQNAWQSRYEVVDCDSPHRAQVVVSSVLPNTATFPGQLALAHTVAKLCDVRKIVDSGRFSNLSQLTVVWNYPVTHDQWLSTPIYQCIVVAPGNSQLTESVFAPTS